MIYPATDHVLYDEPCYGLYELNLKSADQKSRRRFQVIVVVRDDKLAEFRKDLGLAKKFKVDQFRIPGGVLDETTGRTDILHTVGELQDIADYLRTHRPFDKRELVGVNKIN
jgi:hypothetical protein